MKKEQKKTRKTSTDNESKILHAILFALITMGLITRATACNECKCYEFQCPPEEDTEEANSQGEECVNLFMDTCDNSENIVDFQSESCTRQCHCCLKGQCYTWQQYPCLMYRTYGFFNVLYFIMITINGFSIYSLVQRFYSKGEKRAPDEREDDEEETAMLSENTSKTRGTKKKGTKKNPKSIFVKISGKYRIKKIQSEIDKIKQLDRKKYIEQFFDKLGVINGTVAFKNRLIILVSLGLYTVHIVLHLVSVRFLKDKPFVYITYFWFEHSVQISFWILSYIGHKRTKSYISEVKRKIRQFKKLHGIVIRLYEKEEKVCFVFKKKKKRLEHA